MSLIIDLFAGGGGASTGIEAALGRPVDIAINHSAVALAVHQANHPGTKHLTADIWEVKPKEATGGLPVDLLWASPDCTHFSVAKGGKPRKQNIRSLAWAVVRWASDVRPKVIALENVAEFRGWGPLDKDGKPIKTKMGQTFLRWKSTGSAAFCPLVPRNDALEPHELLAAQFGKYATRYDLSFAKTKAAKVRLIGNSVCPEVAEALIRANFEVAEEAAA